MQRGSLVNQQVRSCNFNDFYYFRGIFTDELIEKTHAMVYDNGYKFEKGGTGYAESGGIDHDNSNNRDIAYIPWVEHSHFVYELLEQCVIEANNVLFQFDINMMTDFLHYVIYPTPNKPDTLGQVREKGGHLDWHMDIGQGLVNRRKLATTVQLSHPDEYEGGDFQIWYGGEDGFITLPREKGDVLIFPTFYLHRVTPITKGERRALVYWTGGEPFR